MGQNLLFWWKKVDRAVRTVVLDSTTFSLATPWWMLSWVHDRC